MAFKLAELIVQITGQDSGLKGTLAGVRNALHGMGNAGVREVTALSHAFMGVGRAASVAFGGAAIVGLGAAGAGLYKAVSGASDLAETMGKVDQVFGDSSKVITDAADEMARAFGIPKREFLDAASQFGLIAEGMGKTRAEAAGLGVQMGRLAIDAASFYNVSTADALEKIRAGLTGESEPLKAFGIIMDEDSVKAQAYAMGLAKVGGELSNQAKLAARVAIIQRGLSSASGDLERTQGGAANQSRKFWGNLQNLGDSIGSVLLPAFTDLLGIINRFGGESAAAFERGKAEYGGFVSWIKDGADIVVQVFRNLDLVGQDAFSRLIEGPVHLAESIAYVGDVARAVAGYFGANFSAIIGDQVRLISTMFLNLKDNIGSLMKEIIEFVRSGFRDPIEFHFKPIMQGMVQKAPDFQMPDRHLTDFEGQRRALHEAMVDREREAADAKVKAATAAAKPGALPQAPAKAAKKDTKAEHVDLADYAKKLQKDIFGKAKDRESLDVARRQLGVQQQILQAQKNMPAQPGFAV